MRLQRVGHNWATERLSNNNNMKEHNVNFNTFIWVFLLDTKFCQNIYGQMALSLFKY